MTACDAVHESDDRGATSCILDLEDHEEVTERYADYLQKCVVHIGPSGFSWYVLVPWEPKKGLSLTYSEQQYDYALAKRRRVLSHCLSQPQVTIQEGYVMVDWRGNPYTTGMQVLYPRMQGQCVEMAEGTLMSVWLVRRNEEYAWKAVELDEAVNLPVSAFLEWRARVQPTLSGSRYTRSQAGSYKRADEEHPPKVVTLTKIENITVAPVIDAGPVEQEIVSPYVDWSPNGVL